MVQYYINCEPGIRKPNEILIIGCDFNECNQHKSTGASCVGLDPNL